MDYHYSVIYNRSDGNKTGDSDLALEFVIFLVEKISRWGYKGYFADRDAIPGTNIFDELLRIASETEKTIVVVTSEFEINYWAKYSKQLVFKYLIEQKKQHKLIPIVLGCDGRSLKELIVNEPIYITGLTRAEWECNNRLCFDRLMKAFDPPTQPRNVQEIEDNRQRTGRQQQFVTRPSSETSSSPASSIPDERLGYSGISGDIIPSIDERQNILDLRQPSELHSMPAFDGDTTTDMDEFPNVTTNRLPIEQDPTARRSEQMGESTGRIQSSTVTNQDDERTDCSHLGNDRHWEMSTLQDYDSLSDDRDLSVDVSVLQGTDEDAPRNSFEPSPETFEETCSSVIDSQLQNQTQDANSSGVSPTSDASPSGGANQFSASTPRESGNSKTILRVFGIIQTVTKSMLNIDKAF